MLNRLRPPSLSGTELFPDDGKGPSALAAWLSRNRRRPEWHVQ